MWSLSTLTMKTNVVSVRQCLPSDMCNDIYTMCCGIFGLPFYFFYFTYNISKTAQPTRHQIIHQAHRM